MQKRLFTLFYNCSLHGLKVNAAMERGKGDLGGGGGVTNEGSVGVWEMLIEIYRACCRFAYHLTLLVHSICLRLETSTVSL